MQTIFNFYHFIGLDNLPKIQFDLLTQIKKYNVLGTILISHEGINGGVAGGAENINLFRNYLDQLIGTEYINTISTTNMSPFSKQRVKIKTEIIKMNKDCLYCTKGTYLNSYEWHEFIQQEDTVIFDTRNVQETGVGNFKGSIVPSIKSFSQFPQYFTKNFSNLHKDTPIGMYCTGGVRCEKATAFILNLGYTKIYHLKGGILAYLKDIPQDISLWEGGCYVFDKRVVIDSFLKETNYVQCFACRQPLSYEDQQREQYIPGISCTYCVNEPSINRDKLIDREFQKLNLINRAHKA